MAHSDFTNSAPDSLALLICVHFRASPTQAEGAWRIRSHLRGDRATGALCFEELLDCLLPAHAIPPPEKP